MVQCTALNLSEKEFPFEKQNFATADFICSYRPTADQLPTLIVLLLILVKQAWLGFVVNWRWFSGGGEGIED
jgi:hypothetical protein